MVGIPRPFGVIKEFIETSRGGDVTYGIVAGIYPTTHPALPNVAEDR
jgi:hypothetical protein